MFIKGCHCCGCGCVNPCDSTTLRATYQGQTLSLGDTVTVGGNLFTEGREDWEFGCDTFEAIDETGTSYTFDGLLFAYTKILTDCEEEWREVFLLSCSGGQWTADIYRSYVDRESIGGASPCFDEFAPPCEQWWFDVTVSLADDCLPTGDVEATGSPDIEEDNGGTACGGGTFAALTLGRAP